MLEQSGNRSNNNMMFLEMIHLCVGFSFIYIYMVVLILNLIKI